MAIIFELTKQKPFYYTKLYISSLLPPKLHHYNFSSLSAIKNYKKMWRVTLSDATDEILSKRYTTKDL